MSQRVLIRRHLFSIIEHKYLLKYLTYAWDKLNLDSVLLKH
jgi:hypothetical protein